MAQAIAQARNNPRMPYGCILLQQKTGVAVATGYYNEELYLVNCQMVRALTDRVSAGSYVARCYGCGELTGIKLKSDSYLTPNNCFPRVDILDSIPTEYCLVGCLAPILLSWRPCREWMSTVTKPNCSKPRVFRLLINCAIFSWRNVTEWRQFLMLAARRQSTSETL